MHKKLNHPNIIKLIDVHIDKDRQITYMILEYADGGNLFQKIQMKQVSKKEIRKYFKDICLAVEYLHK
jgi:serine/threonine protein kinase